MDGGLSGIDWKQLSAMVGPALQQKIGELPPAAQRSLHETGAYVTLQGDSIHVDIRFTEEDGDAETTKAILLSSLIDAIPHVIKIFGCRVFVRKINAST